MKPTMPKASTKKSTKVPVLPAFDFQAISPMMKSMKMMKAAMARQVAVEFVAGEMPEIRANAELLHRAIENIVRNALRYSPDGGTVRIEAGRQGSCFRLVVIDHGPGVAEDELAAIFTPFFRGPGQSSGGGYGLGLAIAKRVVAAVNGKIEAKNAHADHGLIVEIVLPV